MKRSDAGFFVGFQLCGLLLAAITVAMIFGFSFGHRDAFCYPSYKEWFLDAAVEMGAIATPFLAGMTLLGYWRFRENGLWVVLAFVPVLLFASAFGSFVVAELANIEVSRDHCAAASHPETGDDDAPTAPLTPVLVQIAKYSSLGFLASLILVPLFGISRPRR